MKKFVFGIFALLLSVSFTFAQSDQLRTASRAYDNFALNNDLGKLTEAVDAITAAGNDAATAETVEYNLAAGDIYGAVLNQIMLSRQMADLGGPSMDDIPQVDNPGAIAAQAYMMAHSKADKRGKQRAAMRGLTALQGNLSNAGIYGLQDQNYEVSYGNFSAALAVDEYLTNNGEVSTYASAEGNQRADETYYAGLSALLIEKYAEAKPFYMALKEMNYGEDGSVYDGLYRIAQAEGDMETAIAYLQEGREQYPDDNGLLFTEINYFLQEGQLDVLLDRLQTAIEREPENLGLYITLGSVYDKLYQDEYAAENTDKADEYFEQAKSYYEQVLEKEAGNASAVYSLGALYYNRGANMSQQLESLSDDLSREGQRRYDEVKDAVNAEFERALPFFVQAEQLDPNDTNIVIALREMYARNGEYELSNEFKDRYERIQAGETLTSHFAQ